MPTVDIIEFNLNVVQTLEISGVLTKEQTFSLNVTPVFSYDLNITQEVLYPNVER